MWLYTTSNIMVTAVWRDTDGGLGPRLRIDHIQNTTHITKIGVSGSSGH